MADISQIVDEVRGFLLSYDQSLTAGLSELARAYASTCVETNKRLARCQRLLQQGLRTEAIHLAKEPPDLLDSIQSLDFADRPAWLEVVRQYDLAIPPEFDATAIEFLHAAHLEDQPLRDLLRLHRRLALQRAPLTRRLQVLRELGEKDPNSPIWAADVLAFEAARVEQIRREFAEARRIQDVAALGSLNDELAAPTWTGPPPKPLVREVAQSLAHLRSQRRRQDQVDLVGQLQDAFASLDVDKARELRLRWRQMDGQGPRASNPLESHVEPVFLWLDERDREDDEENRYHQALADLADSVEAPTRRLDLEGSREALLQSGRGVPEDLERRYQERIAEHSRKSRRKARGLIATGALVLTVGLLAGVVVRRNRSIDAEAIEVAARIDEEAKAGRLVEARDVFAKRSKDHPQILGHRELEGAVGRLAALEAAEARRAREFEAIFERARSAPVAEGEPEALAEARRVASTEGELARVAELGARRLEAHRAATARMDSEAAPRLASLDQTISGLKSLLGSREARDQLRDSLREAQANLGSLKAQVDRSGLETRRVFEEISSRADKIRAELDLQDLEQGSEKDVTRAMAGLLDDPEPFARALAESIEKVPNSPRSADFRRVLGEKAGWTNALAWSGFARRSKLAPNGAERSSEASSRLAELEKILGSAGPIPDRALIEELRDHFRAISLRSEGEENLRKQVNELFDQHVIGHVFLTIVSEGRIEKAYYSKEPYDPTKRMLVVLDGYDKNSSHAEYPQNNIISPPNLEAPQSKLAATLKASLAARKDLEGWDAMMLGFMKSVATYDGIDPILKFVMIRRLARIAVQGSRPLAVGMDPLQKLIENPGLADNLLWMKPTDDAANLARRRADELVKQFAATWPEVIARTEAAHRALAGKYARVPHPVGWLVKEASWACRTIPGPVLPASGELCILSTTTPADWEPVGTIREQACVFSPQKFGRLVEGGLVFARPRAGLGSGQDSP